MRRRRPWKKEKKTKFWLSFQPKRKRSTGWNNTPFSLSDTAVGLRVGTVFLSVRSRIDTDTVRIGSLDRRPAAAGTSSAESKQEKSRREKKKNVDGGYRGNESIAARRRVCRSIENGVQLVAVIESRGILSSFSFEVSKEREAAWLLTTSDPGPNWTSISRPRRIGSRPGIPSLMSFVAVDVATLSLRQRQHLDGGTDWSSFFYQIHCSILSREIASIFFSFLFQEDSVLLCPAFPPFFTISLDGRVQKKNTESLSAQVAFQEKKRGPSCRGINATHLQQSIYLYPPPIRRSSWSPQLLQQLSHQKQVQLIVSRVSAIDSGLSSSISTTGEKEVSINV